MDRCLIFRWSFTVSFQILKPIPQKMISLFPWLACQSHLQRYPFCNCDTFEGFLRARLYLPIHRIITQKAISTCHCIMNGMQVPWASHKQHIRFFHFIQFSFRHDWWDWQDTCWKVLFLHPWSESFLRSVESISILMEWKVWRQRDKREMKGMPDIWKQKHDGVQAGNRPTGSKLWSIAVILTISHAYQASALALLQSGGEFISEQMLIS